MYYPSAYIVRIKWRVYIIHGECQHAVSVCFSVQDIPGLTERESDGEVPLVCAVWQWGVWVTCVLSRASLECSRRSGLEDEVAGHALRLVLRGSELCRPQRGPSRVRGVSGPDPRVWITDHTLLHI